MAASETFFFRIYDKAIDQLLADMSLALKKDVPTLIRERAQFFARYMASNTAPWLSGDGSSLAARDVGRAAVRRDIGRVYSPASKTYDEIRKWSGSIGGPLGQAAARGFYRLIKRGQFAEAQKLLQRLGIKGGRLDIVAWDSGAQHEKLRNNRGRINKGVRPVVVADSQALRKYVAEVEKRVGYTKSGWVTAGDMINSRGSGQIPGWFKKGGPGTGVDDTRGETNNPSITLRNDVAWSSTALPAGAERRAVRDFSISLREEFQRALAAIAARDARRMTIQRAA